LFPSKNKWLTFMVVAAGVFMSTLDSSMVNIALPSMMNEFSSSLHHTEWVVMVYLLTITASLLFWGHLSDRLGRGRIYSSGMLTFGLGSLACAYSPQLSWLIFFRFAQALGAAMMMSTGPAIIKDTFPKEQLGRGLGLIGVAVSLGLMSGPAIGGVLIDLASWRAIFWVTVPIGLFIALFGRHLLPPGPDKKSSAPLDWLGGLCWACALLLLALAITNASQTAWDKTTWFGTLLLAGCALLLFIKIENTVPYPLLQLSLFGKRFFTMGIISATLSFMLLFAAILLTPFYLVKVQQLSASRTGLVMMALPSSLMVVAPLAGWLADRLEARLLTTSGLALSTGGIFLLSTIEPQTSPTSIALRLLIIGCGQALFLSPNSASVLGRVEREQTGSAAAILATARNLGMLLGIAQAALVFSLYFRTLTNGLDLKDFSPEQVGSFMISLRGAFQAGACTGILGMATSWVRGTSSRKGEERSSV
jgi:EmrB/QacA subfamily drug resistance transporter